MANGDDDSNNGFQDGIQSPFPTVRDGNQYNREVKKRARAILSTMMNFRPSNYKSQIPSTNYAQHMRVMAREMAKLTFELEQIRSDQSFDQVRSEFLYQTIGHLVFINGQLPEQQFDDETFRKFLLKVIDIYFQGSTPESIRDAVELFADESFTVREQFQQNRTSNTGDISRQFEFDIEFEHDDAFPDDFFDLESNIQLLVELVKPAHTIFQTRHVFDDIFDVDAVSMERESSIGDYRYEDVRGFWSGMEGWTSQSGVVPNSDKSKLKESSSNDYPLGEVAVGSELVVLDGPNSGTYRVIDVDSSGPSLQVYPQFERPDDPVHYHVDVDRKGENREIDVKGEDVSHQFRPNDRFKVDGQGPYTAGIGTTITLQASANYDHVEYHWDLSGDGSFDDRQGNPIDVDVSRYTRSPVTISVKGVSTTYGVSPGDLDEGEKVYYRPGNEDIDRIELYIV